MPRLSRLNSAGSATGGPPGTTEEPSEQPSDRLPQLGRHPWRGFMEVLPRVSTAVLLRTAEWYAVTLALLRTDKTAAAEYILGSK